MKIKKLLIHLFLILVVVSCSSESDTASEEAAAPTAPGTPTTPEEPQQPENPEVPSTPNDPGITIVPGSSYILYFLPDNTADSTHDLSLNLGTIPQDVFFIFTNDSTSDIVQDTIVIRNASASVQRSISSYPEVGDIQSNRSLSNLDPRGVGLRDRPELFDIDHPALGDQRSVSERSSNLSSFAAPVYNQVNDVFSFKDWDFATDQQVLIPSTLRRVVTVSAEIVLNLWVADDSWGSCAKRHCMTDQMLEAYGGRFLASGQNNDIYDWISGLFGKPWGAHGFSELIDPTAAGQIDILFYDINNDDSDNGGVVGFYWPKDNFVKTQEGVTSSSNERLMFYMDAVMSAAADGVSWEITDFWPSEMVSTLAHEFQHMIHFYQKSVINNTASSEAWLNEMCSLMAEDFISDKIQMNGPRGVAFDDYTGGPVNNPNGRLPGFNQKNYTSLLVWPDPDDVLYSYSASYSFGAYLARNYGGAPLFREIVQNSRGDYRAVLEALESQGHSGVPLGELIRDWAIAGLLSDNPLAEVGLRYNSGGAHDSTVDVSGSEINYRIGSINLFNYDPSPSVLDLDSYYLTKIGQNSNIYAVSGRNLTGPQSWSVKRPVGVKVTIVVKER